MSKMVKRDDIPGLDNYVGSEFIVGYLTEEEFLKFWCSWNSGDTVQDCIITITKLVNCGTADGTNDFSHKGTYISENQDYSKEAGFTYSSPYTIEPEDLVSEDVVYYKIVIYSIHYNYFNNYLLHWFEDGILQPWVNKFYLTKKST